MKLSITIGFHKTLKDKYGDPITVTIKGSTKHWPRNTFHDYTWYRVTILVPTNMSRPKILGWILIPGQEI